MGKIPRKKHRGVKDPYKQEEARLNKVKDKVNKTPKSIEVQEIPRKLQSITKFNSRKQKKGGDSVAVKKKKKKRKKNLIDGTKFVEIEHEQRGMTRPTKMIPVMKQNPNESQKRFLKRVDIMTKVMMKEAAFEDKFQVDVMRDSSGQVLSVSHREKIDAKLSQDPQNISRAQKRTQGKKERDMRKKQRAKKEEDDDEFSYFQDKIEFGEVVYEPPTLNTEKLTRKVNGGIAKPKSFLFMNKLKPEGSPDITEGGEAKEGVSAARHRMVEAERVRAVEAYRKAKEARSHAVSLTGLS